MGDFLIVSLQVTKRVTPHADHAKQKNDLTS